MNRPLTPTIIYKFRQRSIDARFCGPGHVLFLQGTTGLVALADRADGHVLWTYKDEPLPRRHSYSPAVIGNTVVAQFCWEAELYEPSDPILTALSADRGELLWRRPVEGVQGTARLHEHEGRLFGWSGARGIFEVDLSSGRLRDVASLPTPPGTPVTVLPAGGRFVRLEPSEGGVTLEAFAMTDGRRTSRAWIADAHPTMDGRAWANSRYVVALRCGGRQRSHPSDPGFYKLPFEPKDPSLGDRLLVFDLEEGRVRVDLRLPWHCPAQPLLEEARIRLIGRDSELDWFPVIDVDLGTGVATAGPRIPAGSNHGDGGILARVDGALIMDNSDIGIIGADANAPKGRRWTLDAKASFARVLIDGSTLLACSQSEGHVYQAELEERAAESPRRVRVVARRPKP